MTEKQRNLAAACLLVLGAVFLTVGLLRGEPDTVWRKAANICMECIGLG